MIAGDVYTQAPHVGRGGWSWYTGAAAWLHRAAVESIFGLRLEAQTLSFVPCLPTHWARADLTLKRDGRTMRFILMRASATEALAATATQAATLLRVGEALHWTAVGPSSCFVVPIAEAPAAPAGDRVDASVDFAPG